MPLRSVEELKNIRGKRVLVRVDFNVPMRQVRETTRNVTLGHHAKLRGMGLIEDDTRIQAALPTIDFLLKRGAKVILMSHYARPRAKSEILRPRRIRLGRRNPKSEKKFDLKMIAERLGGLLNKKVVVVEKWDFAEISELVKKLKAGEVLMLPNLRLHPGEEKNSKSFAQELAKLGDLYVNEAFGVDHRAHASLVGVPKFLSAYGGLRLMQEVKVLSQLVDKPEVPFVVLMGGAKLSDKAALIKKLAYRAQTVLIGTALANTFFKAAGYGVGDSLVDSKAVREAKLLLKNKKIILPEDLVIGDPKNPQGKVEVVVVPAKSKELGAKRSTPYALCSKPYAIVDIGPRTILNFARHLKVARTLLWNGPVGMYEIKRFSHGTAALARLFASRSRGQAYGVAGGGETVDALKATGLAHYVDFVSTGGGAMLEFLSGKKLPGIVALKCK